MYFSAALITVFVPLIAAFPLELPSLKSLLSRDLASSTQNDLVNGSPCKAITVLFARGTTSPGNMGESTGPPFVQAIGALVGTGNIAVQGIDYPASVIGFLQGGDAAGSTRMHILFFPHFTLELLHYTFYLRYFIQLVYTCVI